jgi:predicted HicB family RNase H-like nuclease
MKTEQPRPERLEIRIDEREKAAFTQAAEVNGISLSAWVRQRLRRAAKQDLEEAGRKIPFLNAR